MRVTSIFFPQCFLTFYKKKNPPLQLHLICPQYLLLLRKFLRKVQEIVISERKERKIPEPYTTQNRLLTTPKEEGFGKHRGTMPAFSPFPTVFSTLSKREILI